MTQTVSQSNGKVHAIQIGTTTPVGNVYTSKGVCGRTVPHMFLPSTDEAVNCGACAKKL